MTNSPVRNGPGTTGAGSSPVPMGVVVPFNGSRRGPTPDRTAEGSADGSAEGSADGSLTVDCADCCHRLTSVCDDCIVSFIVGREPEDALVIDADEARAVRMLEHAGLVPGVRHESRASGQ